MSMGAQGGIEYVDHLLVDTDDYRLLRLIEPSASDDLFESSMQSVRGAWLLYRCLDAGDSCILVRRLDWSYLSYLVPSISGGNVALSQNGSVIAIMSKNPPDFIELYRLDMDGT